MRKNPIIQNTGFNKSEKYLAKLCSKTFLSLWSYPNLYRKREKELCDLLVVFGEHVLIFSDKTCVYPTGQDINLNWKRWFGRAVEKSANQLWGAERWIKQFPEEVFLDKDCKQLFPFKINIDKTKFHLVSVARGVSSSCKNHFGGGSGSLIISNNIRGINQHIEPFTIGDIDLDKTFIHVLDDTTLDIIMNALDTISDFVSYISKKEELFRSERLIYITGEEELLPFYMGDMKGEEHGFNFPEGADIFIAEGEWKKFCNNPQRKAQIKEDKISYMWDKLIEHFNMHTLRNNKCRVPGGGIQGFESSEKIMRFFAKESRYRRRVLAKGLYDLMINTPKNVWRRKVCIPHNEIGPFYIFMAFPRRKGISEKDYRKMRSQYLQACARILKLKFPKAEDIIGFATESGALQSREISEDSMYFDGRCWDKEDQEEAERLQKELKIFTNSKYNKVHDPEFPDILNK